MILDILGKPNDLIKQVADRLGHDFRYSIDCSRAHDLGWQPAYNFEDALAETVEWYVENRWWWEAVKNSDFEDYYREQYKHPDD
jgi:dTDP-glucose 4,6-dehydratase